MQAEENDFSKKISTIKMYAVYIGYSVFKNKIVSE